jgi:hypothetical protein
MKRALLFLMVSFAIVWIAGCSSTSSFVPTPTPSPSQVAFLQAAPSPTPSAANVAAALPSGNVKVMVMNADGSGLQQVGPTSDYGAVDISHDGTKVVGVAYDPEVGMQLFVGSDNGATIQNITPAGVTPEMPEFSPDGTKVYFVNVGASCWEIWSVNTDGTQPTNLGDECGTAMYEVTVAPNGKLYFRGNSEPGYGIYTMDANGANIELLIEGSAYHPSVTPDGTKLVFEVESEGTYITIANVDGSNVQTLTTGGNEEDPIVIGDKIFYISNANSNPEVYSMDLNGANQTRLTTNTVADWFGDFYTPW